MRGIKIPLHDFALKMQGGGLCARGGVFAGHYGTTWCIVVKPSIVSIAVLHGQ